MRKLLPDYEATGKLWSKIDFRGCGGCPICSDETGYFYAARQSEVRATIAQLTGRISKIAAAKNGLLKSQKKEG